MTLTEFQQATIKKHKRKQKREALANDMKLKLMQTKQAQATTNQS